MYKKENDAYTTQGHVNDFKEGYNKFEIKDFNFLFSIDMWIS